MRKQTLGSHSRTLALNRHSRPRQPDRVEGQRDLSSVGGGGSYLRQGHGADPAAVQGTGLTAARPGPRTCPPRCGSPWRSSTPPACGRSPRRPQSAGSGTGTHNSSALQRRGDTDERARVSVPAPARLCRVTFSNAGSFGAKNTTGTSALTLSCS